MNFKYILIYLLMLAGFFMLSRCSETDGEEVRTEIMFTAVPQPADIDDLQDLIERRLNKAGVQAKDLALEQVDSTFYRLTFKGKAAGENLAQLLETTGKLTVYSTWNNKEIFSYLNMINTMLGKILYNHDSIKSNDKVNPDTNQQGESDSILLQGKRVKRSNGLFDIVKPATTTENGKINLRQGPVIGYIVPIDTVVLRKVMQMKEVRDSLPRGLKPALGKRARNGENNAYELVALRDFDNATGISIMADNINEVELSKPKNKQDVTEVRIKLKKDISAQLEKLHKQNPENYMAITADETVIYYWNPAVNDNFRDLSIMVNDEEVQARAIAAILENPMPYKIKVHSIGRSENLQQEKDK